VCRGTAGLPCVGVCERGGRRRVGWW
jgi:hypothetical protein